MLIVIHVCIAIMWWSFVLGGLEAYDRSTYEVPGRALWTIVLFGCAWCLTMVEMWL